MTCFRHALKLNPDLADAYRNLALTGGGAGNGSEIARLADLLDQSSTPLIDRITAGFALGKLLDDAGAFPEAFRRYADANALFKRMQADMGQRFDSEALRRTTSGLIETFTPGFFAELARADNRSELPVFIVGMPRSGTSLVEQIVASHPDVFGAGELTHIGQIAGVLRRDGAEFCSEWKAELLSRLSNDHLGKLLRLAPNASRIVDKMPDNLFHLGLISMLFPRARVIVCRRDPRDTCLSCYFQFFPAGNLFSYDLADCGIRHRETERLMIHWRQVLPIAVIEVEYELLVSDLEGQSRRLIAFLGLDWNPACLDFYRTKRTVLTASSWQVRQPLFAGSVGRWRRYERELGPLMESLGAT